MFTKSSHKFLLGVSSGSVLVFDVPSKGSNITLSEVLEEHKEAITDMASECSGSQVITFSSVIQCIYLKIQCVIFMSISYTGPLSARWCLIVKLKSLFQECIADLVSADVSGLLCVWKSGDDFQMLNKIPGFEYVMSKNVHNTRCK